MQRSTSFSGALAILLAAVLGACTAPRLAAADESVEPRNRVRFHAESTREVPNDWIQAVVSTSDEDVDPAALADRINRAMAWALEQARAESQVDAKSGGYRTSPVHEKGKLRRWRASQDLELSGGDSAAMTALLGRLQSRLLLRSFQFSVSHETRARVEQELIAEALDAFQARAELVRKSLDAHGYAIDDISVSFGGGLPAGVRNISLATTSVTPPEVESGNSRLTATVSGSIVLE